MNTRDKGVESTPKAELSQVKFQNESHKSDAACLAKTSGKNMQMGSRHTVTILELLSSNLSPTTE
eukprot:1159852-Pelagomonas_calceolata.AAC.8